MSKQDRKNLISQGAVKICDQDYEMMQVEINRRDAINFEHKQERWTCDSDDEMMDGDDEDFDLEYA